MTNQLIQILTLELFKFRHWLIIHHSDFVIYFPIFLFRFNYLKSFMRQTFYDNFIDITDLMAELSVELSHLEQEEIHRLIDEILHHRVLEIILDDLPEEHHENFFLRFHNDPADQDLFVFLKHHSPTIEDKIQQAAAMVKDELRGELDAIEITSS